MLFGSAGPGSDLALPSRMLDTCQAAPFPMGRSVARSGSRHVHDRREGGFGGLEL